MDNTSLPTQVLEQLREAEAMAASLSGNGDTATAPAEQPQEQRQDTLPESLETTEQQPPTPTADDDVETWKQRYRTLQGKYQAETRSLREQLQAAEARNYQPQNSTQYNASQQQASQASPAMRQETDKATLREKLDALATQYDEGELGTGEYEKQRQAIQDQLDEIRLNDMRKDVTAEAERKMASDRFWSDLDRLVPNWEAINRSQEFLTWLSQDEGLTGRSRNDFLQQAAQSLDVQRVANFYRSFADLSRGQTASHQKSTAPSLSDLVQPGKAKGGAQSSPQSNRLSADDISKMMAEAARTGDPKKMAEVQSEIDRAQKEGRIQ